MNCGIFRFKEKCILEPENAPLSLLIRWTFQNKNPLHLLRYKALLFSIMHFKRTFNITNFVTSKFIKKGGLFK